MTRCYSLQDLHRHPLHAPLQPRFSVCAAPAYPDKITRRVGPCPAIHFRPAPHSAGKLQHTSSQMPTSMATALLSRCAPLLFPGTSGALASPSVHPASLLLLTTNTPLHARVRAPSKFAAGPGCPAACDSPLLPTTGRVCCPARHFGRNQLPDSSFGLSPLYSSYIIELHVRMIKYFP